MMDLQTIRLGSTIEFRLHQVRQRRLLSRILQRRRTATSASSAEATVVTPLGSFSIWMLADHRFLRRFPVTPG
jgi:hypothetical protein